VFRFTGRRILTALMEKRYTQNVGQWEVRESVASTPFYHVHPMFLLSLLCALPPDLSSVQSIFCWLGKGGSNSQISCKQDFFLFAVGWLRQSHMQEVGTCGLWSQCRQQSWFNCLLPLS
jgi:hypothetical protein